MFRKGFSMIVLLLFVLVGSLCAQTLVVGRVLDYDGMPLPGASVSVSGTTNSALTDLNGDFMLEVFGRNGELDVYYVNRKTEHIVFESASEEEIDLGEIDLVLLLLERNIVGVQVGSGANIYHEVYVTNPLTFRYELNLSPMFLGNNWGNVQFETIDKFTSSLFDNALLVPFNVSAEFRIYDVPWKNQKMLERVNGNTGGFFGMSIKYAPLVLGDSDVYYAHLLLVVPQVGYRRSVGKHFNIEFKLGAGINKTNLKDVQELISRTDEVVLDKGAAFVLNVSLLLGFDFVRQHN